MAPRYDDPSEYGGDDGGNYRTPTTAPRTLTTGERARRVRSAGISDTAVPFGDDPEEYGVRVG